MNHYKKYISLFLYLIFSIVSSILAITFSQASKIVDFLAVNQETLEENPLAFFSATAIANRHDGSDAFVVEEPILDQLYSSSDIEFRFRLFTLVSFQENDVDDILVFYLDNILVDDELALLADDGEVDIRMKIEFNQPIAENQSIFQTIPFVTGYGATTRVIFFEYSQFNDATQPLTIQHIEIVYAVLDIGLTSTLVMDEDVMSLIDDMTYQPSVIYADSYLTNPSIYYDANWLTRFKEFNIYDVYYLGGVFLFLLLIGYFSFIYPKMRQKKTLNSNTDTKGNVL
jgi:hypothetical protein